MAYKDEYEVARLYTDTGFLRRIDAHVRGRLEAPLPSGPAADRAARPGHRRAAKAQPTARGCCAPSGCWRGSRACAAPGSTRSATSAERRAERQLIADYEALIEEVLRGLTPASHATAVELASIPDRIRGFGPVKERFLAHAKKREAELLEAFRQRGEPPMARKTRPAGVAVMAG